MKRWILAAALVASASLSAQDRFGTAIFTQAEAPTTAVTLGTLWYETDTDTLRVAVALDPLTWKQLTDQTGGAGVPAGAIIFVDSGACPSGYTEVAGLNDRMVRGTIDASGDVGQAGGSDSVTPTVASLTAAAQDFTGAPSTAIVNHTHGFTNVRGTTTGGQTTAHGFTEGNDTSSGFTSTVTGNPTSGGAASYTPAGTNSTSAVTGTLNAVDTKAAYVNLIGCKKD